MEAALQCSDVLADDVHRRAGVRADEDPDSLISAVLVALNAHSLLGYVAGFPAVLTALGSGLHNMSSQ